MQEDVRKTIAPSWISLPAGEIGSKGYGRLSADQWRVFCTISLVFTLVPLWSTGTEDMQAVLRSFIHLVTAIIYATKRSISETDINIVEENIRDYLKTLVELYGSEGLRPNHHLLLHLGMFLRRLGPVHGWWTFAFERYNGIIQRFNTNNRIGGFYSIISPLMAIDAESAGELESTFMRTFCRGSNLRALLGDTTDIKGVQVVKAAFHRFFKSDLNGSLGVDLTQLGVGTDLNAAPYWEDLEVAYPLDDDDFRTLCDLTSTSVPGSIAQNKIQPRRKVKLQGVNFTNRQTSRKDCQVSFRYRGSSSFGQIEQLFAHQIHDPTQSITTVHDFARIFAYTEVDDDEAPDDPFRRFPLLNIRLMKNHFHPNAMIIPTSDIISHVAICPMPNERLAIMCLDRVGGAWFRVITIRRLLHYFQS